jgi:hypothetical protein
MTVREGTFHSRRCVHRSSAAILIFTLACVSLACKRHKRVTVQTVEEEATPLATIVHTADPHAASQLVSGFYGIEQNAWRWTAGKFSVMLRPPRNAASQGATLQLKFALPDVAIKQMKAVSLTAAINGTPLPPESYTQAGEYTFSRDIPANMLGSDTVKVDFTLDKTMQPSEADKRELGVVVSTIGFQAK